MLILERVTYSGEQKKKGTDHLIERWTLKQEKMDILDKIATEQPSQNPKQ